MGELTDTMRIGHGHAPDAELAFHQALDAMDAPRVLEVGTRRWDPNLVTHHAAWREDADWVMSDFMDGLDVDVVSDCHDLKEFDDESFDAFVAISTWEHLERPWEAGVAVARVLKPGGICFVMTHQCFPIHGYPQDFFRYTEQGLVSVLSTGGMEKVATGYQYPAKLDPGIEVERWNANAPVFLNVVAYMRKP